jgi:hypothetical protein
LFTRPTPPFPCPRTACRLHPLRLGRCPGQAPSSSHATCFTPTGPPFSTFPHGAPTSPSLLQQSHHRAPPSCSPLTTRHCPNKSHCRLLCDLALPFVHPHHQRPPSHAGFGAAVLPTAKSQWEPPQILFWPNRPRPHPILYSLEVRDMSKHAADHRELPPPLSSIASTPLLSPPRRPIAWVRFCPAWHVQCASRFPLELVPLPVLHLTHPLIDDDCATASAPCVVTAPRAHARNVVSMGRAAVFSIGPSRLHQAVG